MPRPRSARRSARRRRAAEIVSILCDDRVTVAGFLKQQANLYRGRPEQAEELLAPLTADIQRGRSTVGPPGEERRWRDRPLEERAPVAGPPQPRGSVSLPVR
ncbi:MAG: hypothetical protein AAGB00_00310 [Planctomycetota bacterium]